MFLKFFPFFFSLFYALDLFFLDKKPQLFFLNSSFLGFITLLSPVLILKPKSFKDLFFLKSLSLSLFFVLGTILFFLILKNPFYKNIFILFVSVCFFFFLLQIEKRTLSFLAENLIFLSAFFWFTGLSSFLIYLEMKIWLFILLIGGISFFLSFCFFLWQNTLFSREIFRTFLFYSLVLSLISCQIAWSLEFLPLSYFHAGTLFLISFFTFLEITKHYLRQNLTKKIFFEYLGVSLTLLLILFLTAQWKPI